jgi:hypothetical protein
MTLEQRLELSFLTMLASSIGYLFWYGLLAGGVWLFFCILFQTAFRHRRISIHEQTPGQIRREFLLSLRSIFIFGLITGAVIFAGTYGWNRLYKRPDEYGWTWFFLSVGVMVLMHDAYFYWTHRMMHLPWLYRAFHHEHHRSRSPTPWAAYAFSVPEALVQGGIGALIAFTIPIHRNAPREVQGQLRPVLQRVGPPDGHQPPRLRAPLRTGHGLSGRRVPAGERSGPGGSGSLPPGEDGPRINSRLTSARTSVCA